MVPQAVASTAVPGRKTMVMRYPLSRDAEVGVQQVDVATRRLGGTLEDAAARGQHADLVGKVEGAAGVLLDEQDGEAFLVEFFQGIDAEIDHLGHQAERQFVD